MARNVAHAIAHGRVQHIGRVGTRWRFFHPRRLRFHQALELSGCDGTRDARGVAFLRAREPGAAGHDRDGVVARECHGVLDGGIATAHHDHALAPQLFGRLERVLHARQVPARDLQTARIAIQTDRQDDLSGADLIA